MFLLTTSSQFKKDVKKLKKRSSIDVVLLAKFLAELEKSGAIGIDKRHRPHKLSGNHKDNWEAHIKPDLLIIWFEINKQNEIILIRVGSHSDLF